jgi:hypothetical protein
MPFSSVVVNRPWDAAVGTDLCPAQHPDVAQVAVDDVVVLTHPGAEVALALDPLSTVLWSSFDGRTTLGALADDLVASAGLAPDEAATQLDGMCRWLGWRGFLVEPHVPEARREDWFPALGPDDCPSQKMGLADASLIDLDLGDRRIRLGSTAPDVVDELRVRFADRLVPADAEEEREIICANIGTPTGARRPRHRVVDHWGNLLYTGRRRAVAATALVRIVDDRLAESEGGVWLRTPVLLRDGRAVLVHRAFSGVVERALPRLEREGLRLYESPDVRIDPTDGTIVVGEPSARIGGGVDDGSGDIDSDEAGITPGGRYPIHAWVTNTEDVPRFEAVRAWSQTAVRWDQPHLDAVEVISRSVTARLLGDDLSASAAARALGRAFDDA